MNKKGPIVFIEDDIDDQDVLTDVFKDLDFANEIIFFTEGEKALKYLTETKIKPFIIFSDINMPKLNGRETLLQMRGLKQFKEVPAILFSTSSQPYDKDFAASYNAGFITKPMDYRQMDMIAIQFINHCDDKVKDQIQNIL